MLNLQRIDGRDLQSEPYDWAFVDGLFSSTDARLLAETYPCDNFKTVRGNDGEKGYEYEVRSLVHMGSAEQSDNEKLPPVWRALAASLLSSQYRQALSRLTRRDLTELEIEVNVFHYGADAWMGPHLDLKEKVVTHILYFNDEWNSSDGGCLNILRSSDRSDVFAEVPPIVGNSVVLVRSDRSWHSVTKNLGKSGRSRRSMTVTFYPRGSRSTMWPPGSESDLHEYVTAAHG